MTQDTIWGFPFPQKLELEQLQTYIHVDIEVAEYHWTCLRCEHEHFEIEIPKDHKLECAQCCTTFLIGEIS